MAMQSYLHIFARAKLELTIVDDLRRQFGWAQPPIILFGANLSVKDLRATLSDVSKRPLLGGNIAVVLLNAEAISKEVANTLLKTIEEPPAYLSWHLVTTNESKVIATIVSRCHRYRYASHREIMSVASQPDDWSSWSLIEKLNWALELANDDDAVMKLTKWLDGARQQHDWLLARAIEKVMSAVSRPSANRRLILENFVLQEEK
jgi:hypothetical protein